ncbi:MAG: serine hydrolase [Bacteroidota bacterium]
MRQGVRLDWPSDGDAAIGSIEDGLLARSSDSEELRPTASIAKVITALAIMEKQPFNPAQEGGTYTINKNDVARRRDYISEGGSSVPVRIGMKVSQYQAMQRMLIASDNNMADLLAERIFGSTDAYISYANDMLKRMGLTRTHVADASGFSPATVSTPSELVAIGISSLKNQVIAKIVAQQQAQLPLAGIIKNTNQLLGIDGIVGIKTGTTNKAGSCLLFAARYTTKDKQQGTIVGVIMGDANHNDLFRDTRNLLASAKKGFGFAEVQPKGNGDGHSQKQGTGLPPKQ